MPVMQEPYEMPSRPAEPEENFHEENLKAMLKESKKALLQKWDVTIEHLDYGCIVKIGCKRLAFSTGEQAMGAVNEWQKDPHKELKRWYLALQ